MVEMSLRVLFRPDPNQLPFIYRRLGYGIILKILLILISFSQILMSVFFHQSSMKSRKQLLQDSTPQNY